MYPNQVLPPPTAVIFHNLLIPPNIQGITCYLPGHEEVILLGCWNPGLTCLELQVNPTFCVCQEWSAVDHKTLDA